MNFRKILGLLIATTLSFSVFANIGAVDSGGTGDLTEFVNCQSHEGAEFVIRGTAIPTYIQGLLTSKNSNRVVNFKCVSTVDNIADAPTPNGLEWVCTETRNGDGKYIVEIERGSFTGLLSAYVKIEQIFPLKPKHILTLSCRE